MLRPQAWGWRPLRPASFVRGHDHGHPPACEHCGHEVRETVGGQVRFTPINEKIIKVNTIIVVS